MYSVHALPSYYLPLILRNKSRLSSTSCSCHRNAERNAPLGTGDVIMTLN